MHTRENQNPFDACKMNTDVSDRTQGPIVVNRIEENEVSRGGCLSVVPPKLEFTFDSGNLKAQERTVHVANYFSKSYPVQLLPLETRYFRIKNAPQKIWLDPGAVFKIRIAFVPDENRDYNDALRIRYFRDRLVEVKVHAKTVTKFSFPTTVNFGDVPLGRTVYYEIPIRSHAEKEFSFAILPSQKVSCLDIYPRWGRIKPGQKPTIIMIVYRPVRYISANFQVRIFVSDLCKAPHVISFYAYTRPGLLRDTLENIEPEARNEKRQKTIGAAGCKVKETASKIKGDETKFCSTKEPASKCASYENILLEQCGHFPLHTSHAVNCILNSKTERSHDEYELKGPLNAYLFIRVERKAQKAIDFFTKVKCRYLENVRAKFHDDPKLNRATHSTDESRTADIKVQRSQDWEDYKSLTTNWKGDAYEQERTKKIRQRILRTSQKHPTTTTVRSQRDEPLSLCIRNILPFHQAARKIVLRNRLLNVLDKLRKITPELIGRFEHPIVGNYFFTL